MSFIVLPVFCIYYVFLTYELVVKLSVVEVLVKHLQAGKEGGMGARGYSGSVLFVVCVGRTVGLRVCVCVLRQISFVVPGLWWEALVPVGIELGYPKTIPRGDVGV